VAQSNLDFFGNCLAAYFERIRCLWRAQKFALIECQASFFRRERKKSMHICVKSAEAELGKCPASDMRLCIQAVMLSIVRRYIQ